VILWRGCRSNAKQPCGDAKEAHPPVGNHYGLAADRVKVGQIRAVLGILRSTERGPVPMPQSRRFQNGSSNQRRLRVRCVLQIVEYVTDRPANEKAGKPGLRSTLICLSAEATENRLLRQNPPAKGPLASTNQVESRRTGAKSESVSAFASLRLCR